jgi:hypothetical protein
MGHKVLPQALAKAPTPSRSNAEGLTRKKRASREMLTRRVAGDHPVAPTRSESAPLGSENQAAGDVLKAELSAAFGCKTAEVAFNLLEQVMALEHPTTTMEPARVDTMRMNRGIAMLGELQPVTATEAMLAA